jgi:hypothetical protein
MNFLICVQKSFMIEDSDIAIAFCQFVVYNKSPAVGENLLPVISLGPHGTEQLRETFSERRSNRSGVFFTLRSGD